MKAVKYTGTDRNWTSRGEHTVIQTGMKLYCCILETDVINHCHLHCKN